MSRSMAFAVASVCAASLACVGPEDVPSKVHDLRVLGIRVEPPELMAPLCVFDLSDANSPAVQAALAVYATPVKYTALIADPSGGGREIDYELIACPRTGDRTCEEDPYPLAPARGEPSRRTTAGELNLDLVPAAAGLDTGDFTQTLLYKTLQADTYRGLGGIRVPLNLHLEAGDEEIWAQKLMVYSCNFFPRQPGEEGPTMKQNVTPILPGVTVDGRDWPEGELIELTGPGPFKVQANDFKHLQEHYVVPSFELEPVELDESWEVAWHADLGQFSPNESGGADPAGGEEKRIEAEWTPGRNATERDVTFWFVVRDGRGGQSWLTRRAHYRP